jgi:hypothetical protein
VTSRCGARCSHDLEPNDHDGNGQNVRKETWFVAYSWKYPCRFSTALLKASQNEGALKNMMYGQALNNLIPLVIRLFYLWMGRPLKLMPMALYISTLGISQFIYTRLAQMGKPRRDAAGAVVSPGEDLGQTGVTEWMFDVLYISCARHIILCVREMLMKCLGAVQTGSAALGEWVWWVYAVVRHFDRPRITMCLQLDCLDPYLCHI